MIWYAASHFDALPDVMNIGLGTDYSVLDYYEAIAKAVGWTGLYTFNLDRPVGMKRKLVDVSHQLRLGFPPVSSLEQGLAETYNFFLESSAA